MAEEDTRKNSEELTRSSKSVTVFLLGQRKFRLNEMSIGRAKKFVQKVTETMDSIKARTGKKNLAKLEITKLVVEYGGVLFEEVAKLFNWVFEYRNDGYEPASTEWVEENITIRQIISIIKEIAEQNQMGWIIPFFQSRMREALRG